VGGWRESEWARETSGKEVETSSLIYSDKGTYASDPHLRCNLDGRHSVNRRTCLKNPREQVAGEPDAPHADCDV